MKTRRHFLLSSLTVAAGAFTGLLRAQSLAATGENIRFGLCTYQWGAHWTCEELVEQLTTMGIKGVELRVEHAHGVSPKLTAAERENIKTLFSEGGVEVVGLGTNWKFDSPNADDVKKNIESAKEYIRLSHDVGGSGVKVKPDKLHVKSGVDKEVTLTQIAKALKELGQYGVGFGQEIRLEVHGDVTNLQDIRSIMEQAGESNVRVCWNSNAADVVDGSIEKSFGYVKEYLGRTVHVREQTDEKYPFDSLAKLLVEADYDGWVLLEAASKVEDKAAAIMEHKTMWDKRVLAARKK